MVADDGERRQTNAGGNGGEATCVIGENEELIISLSKP